MKWGGGDSCCNLYLNMYNRTSFHLGVLGSFFLPVQIINGEVQMKLMRVGIALVASAFMACFTQAEGVAKVGDTEYATIDAAIGAVQNGETIELLSDITVSGYFVYNKSFTIDGKGKTITCASPNTNYPNYFVNVANGYAQTFKNVTINANEKVPYAIQCIGSTSKLTLDNVTVQGGKTMKTKGKNDSYSKTRLGYGIHVNQGRVIAKDLTVKNCTVLPVYLDGTSSSVSLSGDKCDLDLIGTAGLNETVSSSAKSFYAYEVTASYTYLMFLTRTKEVRVISSLPWNEVISKVGDYTDVTVNSATVKLLQDVVLSEMFTSNDMKLTIDGNNKAITGTIKFTTSPSTIKNVVLGNGTTLDCTASTTTGFNGVSVAANATIDILLPSTTDISKYSLPVVLGTNAIANITVGDKKYIAKGDVITPAETLAQVGDKQYATLQAAIDAANGATVQVLKDVALTSPLTVPAGTTLTLNLAGRKVTITGADYALINNGKLTIIDQALVAVVEETSAQNDDVVPFLITCAASNDGVVTLDDATGGSIAGVQNNGTFALESGAVVAASASVPAIDNAANAVATITGGTVEGKLQSVDKSALTVTGGSFTGDSNVSDFVGGNYGVDDNGTVISYVVQLGATKYQTLQEAFAAAKEFDVVTVLDAEADVSGIAGYVAEGLFPISNGDKTYTLRAMPAATVEKLPAFTLTKARDAYACWPEGDTDMDRPLDIVMNFLANDDGKAEANESGFADWKCDFYLTFSDMAGASLEADDCYLAGNYGGFGWIVIPADDIIIDNNATLPVVAAYDANITYRQVCDTVKKFTAAIHVADAVMTANPNLKITLQLKMTNNKDASQELVVGSYTYTIEDLKGEFNPTVKVEDGATVTDTFKATVGSGLANAYQATEGKLEVTVVEQAETFATLDVSTDGYEVPTEGLEMTFPVQSVKDNEPAIIVHKHEGKYYVTTGLVEYGFVTYNNTLGFSEFIVGDVAALNAALAEGGEVILSSDIVLNETLTIPEGKEVTLDLNGKSISMEESIVTTAYALNNLGTLTLKDSVGTGSVNARGIYNGYGNGGVNVSSAKLIVESGTYNAKGTNGGAAIFNYGIAEINGGSFTSIGGYSLNNQAGSSMTIADGVTANNGIYCSNAKVTVNGGNISGNRSGCHVVYAWNSELTINGGTFYNNNSGNATIMSAGTTKCTITDGTFGIKDGRVPGNGNTWTSCLTDTADTATMTVNGGTFNGGFRVQAGTTMTINGGSYNDCYGSNYNIYGTVTVKGGTFTDATAKTFADNNLAAGYTLGENGQVVAKPAVAQIGETTYATLQAAIDAAQADDVITFLCDVTQADGVVITDKKLTIDLNGKTFTVSNGANTNNRNFKIDGASEVVILNGTMVAAGDYSSGAYGTVRTEGTAKVELQDLKLYNYRGNGLNVKALGGTTVTMTDVEIYAQYGGGVEAAGGTVELTDVVVQQKGMYTAPWNSMAISVNGGGTVTVQSGTYSTECLTAEEANNQGTSHGPWVAGVLNSGGTLIINGGTFSNDNFGENSLATYARGAILADTGANIQINGGTFNALKAIVDIQNNLGDASKNPSCVLAGGTFSADPRVSASYSSNLITVKEDYVVTSANSIYTVVKAIAKIDETYYATLAEALAEAQPGDTITLLADVTASDIIVLDKAITLDGNGKTLTSTAGRAINVATEGCVTIKNLAVNCTGERGINVITKPANLTIENCNITADNYAVNVASSAGAAQVAITGCTLSGLNVVNVAGAEADVTIGTSTINCALNTTVEKYAALCLNKDATGATILVDAATVINVGSTSEIARNGAEDGSIKINGVESGSVVVAVIEYGDYYNSYATIAEAIAAATDGQTIKLIRDVTIAEKLTIEKNLTIDGNGKTLTYTGNGESARAIDVPNNADAKVNVTIKNLTVDCTASYCQRGINYNDDGELTLEGVTVKGTNVTYALNLPGSSDNAKVDIKASALTGNIALNVWGENVTITATNTAFTSVDTVTHENYSAIALNNDGTTVANGTIVTITGGSITALDENDEPSNAIRNATSTGSVNVSATTVVNGNYTKPVAIVDYGTDQFYSCATLQQAINKAIETKGSVKLLTDTEVSEIIEVDGAVVIDLNGKEVTGTAKKVFEVYANTTIKNGTITGVNRCVDTRKAVELTLTDVTLVADEYTAAYGNPQPLTIGGSEDGTKVTMSNVTISAQDGYGIITFVKTNLTAKDSTISGYSALYVKPGSEESTFAFVKSMLSGSTGSNDVEGNSFSAIAIRADTVAVTMDSNSTLTATGNFCSALSLGGSSASEATVANATVTIAGTIEGNIFSATTLDSNTIKVKAEYADDLLAEGYCAGEADANGLVVIMGKALAQIGDKYYATVDAALAAAQDGDTITLIRDVTATDVILIGKSIKINGNGHKVTSSATRVFRVTTANTEVTLNDVNMISTAVRVGTNDIRGISIDILDNVELTLTNCSVDFTDPSANDWAYAVNVTGGNNHTLTVTGGIYEGANVINVRGANNVVTVTDATLNSMYPNHNEFYGAGIWVEQEKGSSVEATGNTFNGSNAVAFNLGTGTTLTESNNTDNTTRCVAKIGEQYYTSLEAALAAAQAGQSVTLLMPPTADEGVEITAGQLTGVKAYDAATLLGGTFKKTAEGTLHYDYAFGVSNVTYTGGDDFTLTIAIEDADSTVARTLTGRTLLIDMKVDGAVVKTFTVTDPAFVAVNGQVTCDVDVELPTLTLGNGEGKATYFEVKVSDAAVVAP